MSKPNALLLLADHLKLSLLERQRAKTLHLGSDSQDGHISRSLDQFRDGLENLTREQQRLQEAGEDAKASALGDTLASLQKQYDDLTAQFHGFSSPAAVAETLTHPNDPALAEDFARAQSSKPTSTSSPSTQKPRNSKTVRFANGEPDLEAALPPLPHERQQDPNRSNLFPYRDDPLPDDDSAGYRDQIASDPEMTNQQIHAYHQQILQDQDAQLDALGASISRQRELSMQIGDELDSQVLMLDESERAADRHQSTLDRARRQMGRVTRKAGSEGGQMTIIVVLIIILVLLIVILK